MCQKIIDGSKNELAVQTMLKHIHCWMLSTYNYLVLISIANCRNIVKSYCGS